MAMTIFNLTAEMVKKQIENTPIPLSKPQDKECSCQDEDGWMDFSRKCPRHDKEYSPCPKDPTCEIDLVLTKKLGKQIHMKDHPRKIKIVCSECNSDWSSDHKCRPSNISKETLKPDRCLIHGDVGVGHKCEPEPKECDCFKCYGTADCDSSAFGGKDYCDNCRGKAKTKEQLIQEFRKMADEGFSRGDSPPVWYGKETIKFVGNVYDKGYEAGAKSLSIPSSDKESLARNIVYQIGDVLYEALPNDIAHKHFVDARQATNDKAIDFVRDLLAQALAEQRRELIEKIKQQTEGYPMYGNLAKVLAELKKE